MSSIILTSTPVGQGDIESVQLNVVVNGTEWVGAFDKLQIFRSTQGPGGPFEEITGPDWARPRLPKDGGDQPASPVTGPFVNIAGKDLVFEANGEQTVVTFVGPDPLTFAAVAAQILLQSFGRAFAYVSSLGKMVLEGTYPGLASQFTILPCEAAVLLDLPMESPDNTTQGRGPRPDLVQGQTLYVVTDHFGSRDYYYRTRLLNSTTGAASDFSVSFGGAANIGVGVSNTIVGYVSLAGLDGKSLRNNDVHVYNAFDASQVGGTLIAGTSVVKTTDENGRAEFTLIRGRKLTVAVQGTSLIRTITVPTDPSLQSFNLFDPSISEDDVFKVSVPDIITAERRTL